MEDNSTKKLDVLMVEPGKEARMVTIDGSLKGLQKAVGGDIEAASECQRTHFSSSKKWVLII